MKINDSLDRMDMRGGGEYHCIGKKEEFSKGSSKKYLYFEYDYNENDVDDVDNDYKEN